MGIIFALISAFSFGISNAYWKKAATGNDYSRIVFFRGLITVSVFAIVLIFGSNTKQLAFLFSGFEPECSDYLIAAVICIVCSFGLVCFLQSLKYAQVGISTALSSINIFSILTAVFIWKESFKNIYFVSFILAGTGVWLIQSAKKGKAGWNNGAWFALGASFFWGISYALFKYPVKWIGVLPLAFMLETTVMITACIWNQMNAPATFRILSSHTRSDWKHYFILALLLISGTLFFNLAIQRVDVLILNLTGNLSLITAVIMGFWWYKEKPGLSQFAGILFILASLVLVQLFT